MNKPVPDLSIEQLTGRDESHLVTLPCGNQMLKEAADAFTRLQCDAEAAGFDLVIASSFRSFGRQLAIWNGKACGERAMHDDAGKLLQADRLSPHDLLHAILRFSALPGSSRHHWGTDVDVYDRAAVGDGYCVQLTPEEVAPGGRFDLFHCWLDERMVADQSQGFFRPYARDRGGVAVERWHLSYAPASFDCAEQLTAAVVKACWGTCGDELLLRAELEAELPAIMHRYVGVEENWCPARYRRAH